MSSNHGYLTYQLELFDIKADKLIDWLKHQQIGVFEPIHSKKVDALFSIQDKKLRYFSWALEEAGLINTIMDCDGRNFIASPEDPTSTVVKVFGKKSQDFVVSFKRARQLSWEDILKGNPQALERFLLAGLRRWLPRKLKWDGSTVYEPATDLLAKATPMSRPPLLKELGVHPAFSIYVRTFDGKVYLHISPTTRLVSRRSICDLLEDPNTAEPAKEYAGLARLAIGRTAEIREITDTLSNARIMKEPFDGRDFLEFAADNYPSVSLRNPNARLAIVVPFGLSSSWIFSTEAMYPSFNFETINNIDPKFLNHLLGVIRTRSLERLENAKSLAKDIMAFPLFDEMVEVSEKPYSIRLVDKAPFLTYGKVDASNLSRFPQSEQAAIFDSPSILFRRLDHTGEFVEKTIYPGVDGFKANLNDLMGNNDLAPLDIQDEIKVTVICDKELEEKWKGDKSGEGFEDALLKGISGASGSYRGFAETFKSNLNITQRFVVSDLLGEEFDNVLKHISPENCHCVLLIIPRRSKTLEHSKRIYLTPKERIMHKGIPVQVIADDERVKGSLRVKAKDPYAVFGLALNIAAKSGSRLTSFSDEFSDRAIGNAVVIGYNVTRIMPKPRRLEQTATMEELAGKTIPLIAPLFIIDNKGSRVLHWDFYRPTTEVSLFSEFEGDIFKHVKGDIDQVIIHKDGPFREVELEDLKANKSLEGMKVIPISLVHSSSIRMHNTASVGVGAEVFRGSFARLDDNHYQLVNTTMSSWRAQN